MAIDPPYRFDPFQNLVNVHWPEETTAGTGEANYIYRIWMDYHFGDVAYHWIQFPWPGHEGAADQDYRGWATWADIVASINQPPYYALQWDGIGGQFGSIFIDTMPLVMHVGTFYEKRFNNYGWWQNIVTHAAAEPPPSFEYSRVRIRDNNIHEIMTFLNDTYSVGGLVVYSGGSDAPTYIHNLPVSPFKWEKVAEISGVYARTSTNVIDSGNS